MSRSDCGWTIRGALRGGLTLAISGLANRRPNCESNLGDDVDSSLHRACWTVPRLHQTAFFAHDRPVSVVSIYEDARSSSI